MTLQEIFNKVAKHLLTQQRRAMSADGTACLYRTPEGLTCAIGCLIPNELYTPGLEGHHVTTLKVRCVLQKAGIDARKANILDLLQQLQKIHDRADPETEWRDELAVAAHFFKLRFNLDGEGRPK